MSFGIGLRDPTNGRMQVVTHVLEDQLTFLDTAASRPPH